MRLMLAVPTHSGSVDAVTATAMMDIQRFVLAKGGELVTRIHTVSGIAMLRNIIAADFLASACDALFMLDADQGVSETSVARMLDRLEARGAAIIGCFYPKRSYDWSMVGGGENSAHIDRLLYRAMTFVGEPLVSADDKIHIDQGFVQAEHVGAGAMLLSRAVIDRLCAAHPDLAGMGFSTGEFPMFPAGTNWGLFNRLANDGAGGGLLSEDLSFCRRWRTAGGEIWAEVATPVAHAGRHIWSGRYVDFLAAIGAKA